MRRGTKFCDGGSGGSPGSFKLINDNNNKGSRVGILKVSSSVCISLVCLCPAESSSWEAMEGPSSAKVARLMSKDEDDKMDEQQRQRRLEDSLQQVLANQLICENIASFLSLSDMKAASEVNGQFLQAIRGTQRFGQVAVLAITDKVRLNIKSTLQKTEFSWRGMKVDVENPSEILDGVPRLLKSAEFVCLGAPLWKMEERVTDPIAVSLLTTVLSSSDSAPRLPPFHVIQPFKLSHVQLHVHFLFTNLRSVLSSPAVQETLRNLSRLDILGTEGATNNPHFINDEEADEEKEPFAMNFRRLTGLPNRLKSFSLPELFPSRNRDMNSVNRSVLRLLKTNRTTMEKLNLHRKVWGLQELGTLTFQVLKTVSATVLKEEEEETLANLLENQRSLEELAVDLVAFHECLVPSIRSRCLELKKLDLTTGSFSGDVEEWSFLGSMNRLKEFRFKIIEIPEVHDEGVTNGWRLLAFLPKNQLESLSLEGISTENYGFWSVEGGVDDVEFGVKTELLEGFRCLRRLSLLRSRDAVDDQLMQWLLKEFLSLEELQLSDCDDLSNAGISGDTSAEWGRNASLSDLRDLKALKILNCPEVTPKGVASCVKLPFLKSLDYSALCKVRESVVLELVEQNPRLERLSLNCKRDELNVCCMDNVQAKVREKNRRVQLELIW